MNDENKSESENKIYNKKVMLKNNLIFLAILLIGVVLTTIFAILGRKTGITIYFKFCVMSLSLTVIICSHINARFIKKYRWLSDEAREECPEKYWITKTSNFNRKIITAVAYFVFAIALLAIW